MRFMGIDYGEKRVGIALSDEEGKVAFPEEIFENNSRLIERVCSLAKGKNVGEIVLGESLNFKNRPNKIQADIQHFKEELGKNGIVVRLEPELFTSAAAARAPAKEGKSRSPRKRALLDASAATLILQGYLDKPKGIRRRL